MFNPVRGDGGTFQGRFNRLLHYSLFCSHLDPAVDTYPFSSRAPFARVCLRPISPALRRWRTAKYRERESRE